MQGVTFNLRDELLILLIIICAATATLGQKPKFKKVSKEELAKTVCEYDSTANAEYLYHGCEIEFNYNEDKGGFNLTYHFHDRIKIYNEEGLGLADRTISYYNVKKKSNREQVANLSGYTFNIEDGKVKSVKLKKDNIFEEKTSKYYSAKKFAMPAVKAGSVLEIRYELRSPHVFKIDEFYFQKDIPVNYAEFEIETPEYLKYNYTIKGLVSLDVEEKEKKETLKYSYYINEPLKAPRKAYENLRYKTNVKKYTARNVKAIKKEPFVYSMDNFKTAINVELVFTQYPRAKMQYFTNTWNDIAQILQKRESFGEQLIKDYEEMQPLINAVSSFSQNEKITTIYSTIQNQYRWNGYAGIRTDTGIKNLIKEGSGNASEINLLLVNTLQKAGINAFPMVYKQRTSGYLNVTNPTLTELDYVVAVIIKDDNITYLDATDKNLKINMLPKRALNLKGVVIMENKGQEVSIQNQNKGSQSKVYTLKYEGEELIGTYKQLSKGYEAYINRSNYTTTEDYIKTLQTDNVTLSNVEVKEYNNSNKPISVIAEIKTKGYTQEIDNKIFIDLMVGQEEFKNPFESEERTFSLFFDSKSSNTKLIKIAIPEGYKVESIPETLNISTPERYIKYMIKTQVVGNEIIITLRNSVNNTIISPEYYETVRVLFDKVAAISKEKIVLTKM